MSLEIIQAEPVDVSPIERPPETSKPVTQMSLEELHEIWVKMKGNLSAYTQTDLRYCGRLFCGFMQGKELNPATLFDYIQWLRTPRPTSQGQVLKTGDNRINTIASKLKAFLKWLKIIGYLQDDLKDVVPRLASAPPPPITIITEEEYQAIKTYCDGRAWCQCHLWLIILAYRTGMSKIDCCYLRWKDVTLEMDAPSYIQRSRHKLRRLGDKAVCHIPIIPFTDVHLWLLNLKKVEHLNYTRFDGITDFVHQDAPGLYDCRFQTIDKDFNNIFLRAGVRGKTFKHLRSAFISNCINSGMSIPLVCKMSGHSNVKTLMRYLKPDMQALETGLSTAFRFAASGLETSIEREGHGAEL